MADADERIDPDLVWPNEAPEEVKQTCATIWKYIRGKDLNVVGPAIAMVFARMVFEAGNHKTGQEFADILEEVGAIIIKWKSRLRPAQLN